MVVSRESRRPFGLLPLLGMHIFLSIVFFAAWIPTAQSQHAVEGEEQPEEQEKEQPAEEEDEKAVQSVFVVEHGFLSGDSPAWEPRGMLTCIQSGTPGKRGVLNFEARLNDANEFIEKRPSLQNLMEQAAMGNRQYSVRIYSPENPKRGLQASIPAKQLVDSFEDWHDILELTVNPQGVPVALNYRIKPSLGLALFEHTAVHVQRPSWSNGPIVAPKPVAGPGGGAGGAGGAATDPANEPSFLRKYWWVLLIVFLVVSSLGAEPEKGGGGGGGGKSGSA